MTQDDLLSFIVFNDNYYSQLKKVGVTDQKITNGVQILCRTLTNRLFDQFAQTIVDTIISGINGNITTDETSGYYTLSHSEFKNTIDPLILEAQNSEVKIFSLDILATIKDTVALYENAITDLIGSRTPVAPEFLVGVCNDSVLLIQCLNQWRKLL